TITPVNIGCGETCTGSATVNVTGGTSPYTYEWSNGETSQGITDLCAGNYSVEVTDALGCSTTANVTITTTPNSLNVTFNQTNIVCPSACNGDATATITGGTAPYLYEWENGETSNSISNLCAGNYTIEVTDANNCTTTATVEIVDLSIPIQITTNVINESCENTCDGSITTTITGGVLPNSFSWNTGQNTQNISNLCDGNYTLTVTDNNGCIQTSQATVLPGDATPTPIITPVNDLTVEDQAVQVVVNTTGGSWSSDCGTCLSATGVFDPAIAGVGTFEICYTIGTGACQETTCIDITVVEHCIPQTTTSTITGCPGETIVINGQPITASGTYPFTFTDVNGCDSTHIVTVTIFTTNPTHDIATICLGDSVEIAGVWHFDAGVIPFETTDANGCILENTTTIIIDDCVVPDFNVFIPNSFTPNGDNVNDVFPITITDGELIEGYIFNRWGEIVKTFSATDLNWDGKTKSGQLSPDGVYSYWVIIQKDGGIAVEYHGFVTLIR
ncbi:MAG TPA: gliding motility-associated C-terminal domain-containing protein, partial [Taishania sp.]|nr:gliding motility-associated C-terminal domain-containing protein [Taishania sp.]